MAKKSPTARTLDKLREDGWLAAVVEKWNPAVKIRNDLFGFIDVLALKDGETLAIQATSGSNVASRIEKIANAEHVGKVREAGWRIEVWGWRKLKGRWTLRVVDCS